MASSTKPTVVLITGANTGLGFEIAKALFARSDPYHIILGARGDLHRAEEAVSNLQNQIPTPGNAQSTATPLSIDITSDSSISIAVEAITQSPGGIDILVNNAGADFDLAVHSSRLTPREGFQQTFDVNVTGTHLLTEKLTPLLLNSANTDKKAKRLIFITSGMSSVVENASGTSPRYTVPPAGWPKPVVMPGFGDSPFPGLAYRASKAALNMLVTEWARVLKNDGVKVFDISPGFLATGLGADRVTGNARPLEKMGALKPEIGGEFLADVIEGKRDGQAWPVRVLRKDVEQPW